MADQTRLNLVSKPGLKVDGSEFISLTTTDNFLLAGTASGKVCAWKWDSLDDQQPVPTAEIVVSSEDSINVITRIKNNEWFCGCGNDLVHLKYDPSSKSFTSSKKLKLADEINGIDINDKKTFAAVVDDTGCLTVIDMKTFKIHKQLLGHENISSCVKFRPKSPSSIVTGGLDCMLILWDFKKGQALGSANVADSANKDESAEKDSYVVNPPLIHSLDITSDGLIGAAGLENAKVILFTIGGKGFKMAGSLDFHTQGVCHLSFVSQMQLVTSGNDGKVCIWKMSTARAPGKTLVWANVTHSTQLDDKPCMTMCHPQKQLLFVVDETEYIRQLSY